MPDAATLPAPSTLGQRLRAAFGSEDLEWKVQTCGLTRDNKPWAMIVPFISARAIQARLDDVVGPEAWRNRYEPILKDGNVAGYLCYLSIRVDGEWIEKGDGADLTDIEAIKGGLSQALKRAGVQWGIGRYLYGVAESWADFRTDGVESCKINGEWYRWNPPGTKAPPIAGEAAAPPANHNHTPGTPYAKAPPAAPAPAAAKPAVVAAKDAPTAIQLTADQVSQQAEVKKFAAEAMAKLKAVAPAPFCERVWRSFKSEGLPFDQALAVMRRRTGTLSQAAENIATIVREGAEEEVTAQVTDERIPVEVVLKNLKRLAGVPLDEEPPF